MAKRTSSTIGYFFGWIYLFILISPSVHATPSGYEQCRRDCNKESDAIKCVKEVEECYNSVDQPSADEETGDAAKDDPKRGDNNPGVKIGFAAEPTLCDGLTPPYKKEKCATLTTTNLSANQKYFVDDLYWTNSLQIIFCSAEFLTNNDEQECREAVNLSCKFWLKSKVKDTVTNLGESCEVTDGGWRCLAGPWFNAIIPFIKAAIGHKDAGFAKVQDQIVAKCSRYAIDEDEWLDGRVEHECLPNYKPLNSQNRECSAAINGTCRYLLRGLLRKAIFAMRDASNKALCEETEAGWDCPTLEWIKKNQSLTQEIRNNPQINKVISYIYGVCHP